MVFQAFVNSYDLGFVSVLFLLSCHCIILDVEDQKTWLSSLISEREDSELHLTNLRVDSA